MIVPRYWAEARVRERINGRQMTVRRFGWSDTSEADASASAETRAREALQRIISGEKLPRREFKRPYNGADGMPIREEIVSRHDEAVITRNGYGARCLNTPNVLFVDVDFEDKPAFRLTVTITALLFTAAMVLGWALHSRLWMIGLGLAALLFGHTFAVIARKLYIRATGGVEARARARIAHYVQAHPEAHLRIYRTPAGLRVLAMHRTFDPGEPAVAEMFQALGADTIYARMCLNQKCFRARVSGKPWRMGLNEHIRPRPGVWPVAPERMPDRLRWIEKYEQAAQGFSACRFVESLGAKTVNALQRAADRRIVSLDVLGRRVE